METLIIANHQKVKRDSTLLVDAINDHLRQGITFTTSAKEANEHIQKLKNPRTIITIGGDGTLTQAIQETMRLEGETIMGVIRYDSGDYARTIGFKEPFNRSLMDYQDEQEYLTPFIATLRGDRSHLQKVDIAKIIIDDKEDPVYAMNWVGIAGYFPSVSHALQQYVNGEKPYLKTARQQRRIYAKDKVRVDLTLKQANNRNTMRGASVASLDLFLGEYFGGGKRVTRGQVDDGKAELVTFKNAKRLPFYANLAKVVAGTTLHLRSKHVGYDEQVIGLTAHFKEPQTIQYDGETYPEAASKVDIEILPRAITMITNSSR